MILQPHFLKSDVWQRHGRLLTKLNHRIRFITAAVPPVTLVFVLFCKCLSINIAV